jgi:hypothetical protein
LEADSEVAKANSEGELAVQQTTIELRQLKNISQITMEAEAQRRVAETRAEGEAEAVRIFQALQNDLLAQKAQLIMQAGDTAKITIFIQQHLEKLFTAYKEQAKKLSVDNVVIMDEKRGLNGVVNRGPEAMVDFLRHFEEAFGINVRNLMTVSTPPRERKE